MTTRRAVYAVVLGAALLTVAGVLIDLALGFAVAGVALMVGGLVVLSLPE